MIKSLNKNLNPKELKNIDILSEEVQFALGTINSIESNCLCLQALSQNSIRRYNITVFVVIGYISIVFMLYSWCDKFEFLITPLSKVPTLPLIGTPWPVVAWSLIGSFASMLRHVNTISVADFSDTFKWFITRPVQGVLLGCTFYLVVLQMPCLIY